MGGRIKSGHGIEKAPPYEKSGLSADASVVDAPTATGTTFILVRDLY